MTQLAEPRNNQLTRVDQIENRINRDVVTSIGLSTNRGMAVDSMGQAMEVAKLMSVSGSAVPKHLRGNPGACLAVAVQGWEWGINPFAIANKSYEVSDRLAYESALYHAVLNRRAPIKGRVKMQFEGGEGQSRKCRVWAELSDGSGIVEYTSPNFGSINPKNSPLWKNDPDQQLFYFSVRAFARRHFPDVMMGISTVDEMQDISCTVIENEKSRTDTVLAKITARPLSEGQTLEPAPEALADAARYDESPESHPQNGPEQQQADTAAPTNPADLPRQQSTATTTQGNAGPAPAVSGAVASPPILITWTEARTTLAEAAMDAGLSESDLWARVNLWLVAKKLKGKEGQTSPEQRAELVAAVRDRRLGADGRISNPA